MQPVRRAGAGQRGRHRVVLRGQLRRDVSALREGRRQRRRGCAGLQVPQEGEAGVAQHRGDQVELHQVPGRPQRQGARALRAECRAGKPHRRHREGPVACRRSAASLRWSRHQRWRSRRFRASAQAEPAKVLHVVFPVAETGFDPQAWIDAYSDYVNTAIFDALYKYDYLARPYKISPNTAAALPEISADGLNWTIRIKPGIYFADDPAFKGKKRELVAADYVYSWKRILDPEGPLGQPAGVRPDFRGWRRRRREGEGNGQIRLRHAPRGIARGRQIHAAAQAHASCVQPVARPHDDADGRGRARSDRNVRRRELVDDGESGRHGPVPAEGLAARPEGRARGESGVSRRRPSPKAPIRPTATSSRR